MKTSIVWVVGLMIAGGLVIGAHWMLRQNSPETPKVQKPVSPNRVAQPATVSTPEPVTPPPSDSVPQVALSPAKPAATAPKQKIESKPVPARTGNPPAKEPAHDPVARMALAFVGMDSDAEDYWVAAINDPSLSAQERQDLIEDLNEDGLSDPNHPGPQDLPLILNRLQLIEEIGPYAMDKVNADAFAEAYKDLVNLANLSMGKGEPVN